MKSNYSIILFIAGIASLVGCSNWLDVVPESDIETIESNFEKREDAEDWLKTCYVFLTINCAEATTGNPAYLGADEFCGGEYARTNANGLADALFIGDGLQMAQDPYCNVWHKQQYYAAIRYCNIFLEHIGDVYNMDDEEKRIWAAEVKAVKAFYYFDLMRRYGPIVLVDENLDPNLEAEEMRQSRRPIDECVDAILALCDEAAPDLPFMRNKVDDHKLYFNKEAVYTLKALTLLYAASPLFNGNSLLQNFENKKGEKLFPEYDKEKWRLAAEACDSAILICELGGKSLVSGSGNRPTQLLNKMMDIERTWIGDEYDCSEAILAVNNSKSYEKLTFLTLIYAQPSNTAYYDWNSIGCLGAPMKMVEMFYTDHGLPIEEDNQWMASKYALSREADEKYRNVVPLNTDILSLHRRREPRFYAMIAADRTIWYRRTSTSGTASYSGLTVMARQGEIMGTTASRYDEAMPQNITGYWIKKWLSSEVAFYNYHNSRTYEAPRYIFRLAELYLAAAEAWNEYLDVPDNRVYDPLDEVRERAGIPKVREAWQSYAKNPDKVNTQAGMREIIQQEWNIEFMFEGRRYWNLRRWMTAPEELNSPQYGWNILASDEAGFYNNFEGPIIVWQRRKFETPKDYFTPIRSEEVLVSGIVQNPGW